MNLYEIVKAMNAGTLNPRQEALKILGNMSPAQRRQLSDILPKVEKMAKAAGISPGDFSRDARQYLS